MRFLKHACVVLSCAWTLSAWALTAQVKALVDFETKSNGVSVRSNQVVDIEHYEIPLDILAKDVSDRLPKEIRDALIFKDASGREYVRWIINPEDTKWHLEVQKWLTKNGLDPSPKHRFKAYQTASRSYIIEDPNTGAQFSAKVSTNKTGGNWTDKKQEWDDAQFVRLSTDHILRQQKSTPFEHVVVMDEPAAFGIESLNQGMLVRTFPDLVQGKKVYIPGFAALHEKTGEQIAAKNGSNDPASFWNEHYNKPLAKALAEFMAKTGEAYDSPHSQNFLIELDQNLKPTGRIVLRDFGDVYLHERYFKSVGSDNVVKNLKSSHDAGNVLDYFSASVGLLHGNTPPSWLNSATYQQWGREFFEIFNKELSKDTGVPIKDIAGHVSYSTFSYINQDVTTDRSSWNDFFNRLATTYKSNFSKSCRLVLSTGN